jgi:hypothetical protein
MNLTTRASIANRSRNALKVVRAIGFALISETARQALIISSTRATVTASDVQYALKTNGMGVYGRYFRLNKKKKSKKKNTKDNNEEEGKEEKKKE